MPGSTGVEVQAMMLEASRDAMARAATHQAQGDAVQQQVQNPAVIVELSQAARQLGGGSSS